MRLVPTSIVLLVLVTFCYSYSAPTVNPWIVEERLSLYDTLLSVTQYPPLFNESNEGNILWGLPLQFRWQNDSGRLMVNNETGLIFGKSWWGCMNYYLSVVPYLGAMNAGVVNDTIILPPTDNDPSKFCLSVSDCNSTLLDKWTTYFLTVQDIQSGNTTNMTVDSLMAVLWEAHTSSILYAMEVFVDELTYLASDQEEKFGIAWGHFVQIIAAARFVTNSTQVHTMQADLPYRMLLASDHPPHIPDFTKNMNVACESMFTIYYTCNSTEYRLFLDTWFFAMESPSCRADAQVMINNFFTNPVVEILKAMAEFALLCHSTKQ